MAAEIPNLVKRNGIYYFRCRIPSILTNGRAREVKISLKTGNLTSDLLDVILHIHLQELMDMKLVILDIEKVGRLPGYGEVISIAHYGEQSGDLMADPEMEFTIIGGDYYPISFRNDYLCKHNSIFEDDGINLPLQHDLTTFANQWMRNIAEQQNIKTF